MSHNEVQVMDMECIRCKKQFEVIQPKMEAIQSMTVSILLWNHQEAQACPHCGLLYQMKITQVGQVGSVWFPVEKKEESRIIRAAAIPNLER